MKTLLIAFTLTLSTALFASAPSETSAAVTEAISLFEKDNTEVVVADFKGLKASPNDHGVSVVVYLKSGSKLSYGCHRHGAGQPFECHEN